MTPEAIRIDVRVWAGRRVGWRPMNLPLSWDGMTLAERVAALLNLGYAVQLTERGAHGLPLRG